MRVRRGKDTLRLPAVKHPCRILEIDGLRSVSQNLTTIQISKWIPVVSTDPENVYYRLFAKKSDFCDSQAVPGYRANLQVGIGTCIGA